MSGQSFGGEGVQMNTRVGNSPVRSDTMLHKVLRALEHRNVFKEALDPQLATYADALAQSLPSHYLPYIVLEQPVEGLGEPRALLALDATERNYLNHLSAGAYLSTTGIPKKLEPEHFSTICGLVSSHAGITPFEERGTVCNVSDLYNESRVQELCTACGCAADAESVLARLLRMVASSKIRGQVFTRTCDEAGAWDISVIPFKTDRRMRFANAPYRAILRSLLAEVGCKEQQLDALDNTFAACVVEGYCVKRGMVDCLVSADMHYVRIWGHGNVVEGASAGILITDRISVESKGLIKNTLAYQWHITDECDQRCKHCYLFAEDARMRCVSTPWDQLIHTLDEVERSAARYGLVPMLAITGGDPILHPRFWDFAAELHARGILWAIMGNPFHLNDEVCLRLKMLGCQRYQMSLDGLESFHDSLRKPGSYRATLAALEPLKAAGIKTQLMATASSQNLDEILACMDVAAEHGVASFVFARYCATSPTKAAELYPKPEEYRAFLLEYLRKKRAYRQNGCGTVFIEKEHLFTLLHWELGEFEVPEWSRGKPGLVCDGCHLGLKCTIAANGDLLACRRMESVVGNIVRDRLYETDCGEAMFAYEDTSHIQKCSSCELSAWCRGCRAVGFNATHDLQAADPMCWHEPAPAK